MDGEVPDVPGPVSALVDTRNGVDCRVFKVVCAGFPAVAIVDTDLGDGAEVGRPRVPVHNIAAGGTFWDAGDEPVHGLRGDELVKVRVLVCEGSGKEKTRARQ